MEELEEMKKTWWITLGLLIGLLTFPCLGSAYTIIDDTLVGKGKNDGGAYVRVGSPNMVDYLGSDFNTHSIEYNYDSSLNSWVFNLYTNFDGHYYISGLDLWYADLALDLDHDGHYDLGVDLSSWSGGAPTTVGVYTSSSWSSWKTSHDYIDTLTGNLEYGEFLYSTGNVSPIVDMVITGGESPLFTTQVSRSNAYGYGDGNVNTPAYKVTFTISDLYFNPSDPSDVGVLWGTALCGNDVIHQEVPIPAAGILMMSGLIGLVGLKKAPPVQLTTPGLDAEGDSRLPIWFFYPILPV